VYFLINLKFPPREAQFNNGNQQPKREWYFPVINWFLISWKTEARTLLLFNFIKVGVAVSIDYLRTVVRSMNLLFPLWLIKKSCYIRSWLNMSQ